ncbi:MAG TPA: sugar porter family MFS transporter [Pseudonocardiaceae bacterium]|jgi:sugar porter (SP) family MFS transporter|nr:sugar porter family MFS transporter [Pseudonocardiaceae bacterium]
MTQPTRGAGTIRPVRASTYFFGALGGLLFGYDLGVVAGALLFITPQLGLSHLQTGMVTSSLLVGAMIGALGCGRITDRVGRRTVVLGAAVLFGLGAIGAALAPNLFWILAFRLIMGLAVGTASVTVPVYLSEISPASRRGSLSGLNQLMISSGILVAYLVNLALAPAQAWRWMFGLAAIPAVLMLIGGYFQPESPRWLIKKGREAEARAVLARSRTPEQLDAEIAEIVRINESEQQQMRLGAMIRDPRLRRVLLIGSGLALLQQVVGVNTVIYYAPTILKSIGFTSGAAILANAGLGGLTVVVTIIMLTMVDRVGRRRPLILGAIGMCAAMVLLAALFYSGGLTHGTAGWLAITGLALFKICFSLSWGGLVWIMLGELFPLRARGTAMGVATFFNWAGNFAVGLLFPVLLGVGTGLVFVIFAVLCLVSSGFALAFVPETKGKSLEQIERDLGHTANPATAVDLVG